MAVEELDGAEACLLPGYVLAALAPRAPGPLRPATRADCQVRFVHFDVLICYKSYNL